MTPPPELSIITINQNNAKGLAKTIKSVIIQNYQNYEYIIIDGASSDDSVKAIKLHQDKIDYWVSESDSGIYNAMNKGIQKAQGKYLLFLNSGDWLLNEQSLEILFNNSFNEDIIYWNTIFERNKKQNEIKTFPSALTYNFFFTNSLGHQSSIIKKSVLVEHGYYDESIKYSSDWVFFIKAIISSGSSYKYLNINISVFDTEGFSGQLNSLQQMYREQEDFHKKHYPLFFDDYILLNRLLKSRATRFSTWLHRQKILFGCISTLYDSPSHLKKFSIKCANAVRKFMKVILSKIGLLNYIKRLNKQDEKIIE